MGAFIVAAVVFALTIVLALGSELMRGMHPAPSMVPSHFADIMIIGTVIAVLIAITHWIPRIGW